MKHFIFVLLVSNVLMSFAQKPANYEFFIESKFKTEVKLTVEAYYNKKIAYTSNDLMIKKINSTVRDSLRQFDIFEMYTNQRPAMQTIIDKVYKTMLKDVDVIIDSMKLISVVIPFEAKELNDKLLNFKKDYLKIETEINDRINALKQKINTNISESEKNEIETEINTLENYKYIKPIFDKKFENFVK